MIQGYESETQRIGLLDPRAALLGGDEHVAQGHQGLARVVGREVVQGDRGPDRREAREVSPDLDPIDIADDEQGRVAEIVLVGEQLDVGGFEVLALALVLPGEEVSFSDVGEAAPSTGLRHPLIEGVVVAGGVGVVRGGLAEHPTQVDEVLLGPLANGHTGA